MHRAPWRGKGLSTDEVAFYDALAANNSAVEALGTASSR